MWKSTHRCLNSPKYFKLLQYFQVLLLLSSIYLVISWNKKPGDVPSLFIQISKQHKLFFLTLKAFCVLYLLQIEDK